MTIPIEAVAVDRARSTSVNAAGSQPVALEDVIISHELLSRRLRRVHGRAEIKAMYELANLLGTEASPVMKRLAQIAIELCDAGSGGISMIEIGEDGEERFRWQALAGEFERFEGGTTPRDWSPCGQCLKMSKPMLYSYPARYFTYFQEVDTAIVEGLVIPMYAAMTPVGTIWIISHSEQRRFDAEDVRVMTSLGSFVAASLLPSRARDTIFGDPRKVGRDVVWAELLGRIAKGDSSALNALIDETKPVIFGTALRILGLRADAEEVTMDVYSHVWKRANTYDSQRGSALTWMLSTARSRAIDRIRSRARQPHSLEGLHVECSNAYDIEGHIASRESRDHLHEALRALPWEQRQAIELAYLSGYSVTEIASRLSLPLGTAKSRIRYGLIRLRRLMGTAETHDRQPNRPVHSRW